MSRIRVAVIGGGANDEHEVSLASAAAALAALDRDRYEPVPFTIGRDGSWTVASVPTPVEWAVRELRLCDVALPLVHGAPGEDGSLAALCELARVPYVGSPVSAAAIAMDKHATKLVAAAAGVAVAAGTLVRRGDDAPPWHGPVVVKPVDAGSSNGVASVTDAAALPAAIEAALAYGDRVLVEERIDGREIDVAVIDLPRGGQLVSPPLEIVHDGVFDYAAKYGSPPDFRVPAPMTDAERAALEAAALAVYRALGCRGMARVDFFLTDRGWLLNEVNTTPGMTAHSQLPKMYAALGMSYPHLLDLLIERAFA